MTNDELQIALDTVPVLKAVPWAVIIPAAISALGMFMGRGKDSGAGMEMTPEMREMFNTQMLRMRQQQPLYNDVMGMARGLLPTRYRNAPGMRNPNGPGGGGAPSSPGGYAPGLPNGNNDPSKPNGGWTPPEY